MSDSALVVDLSIAVEDFYKARRRAKLELVLARLRKKPTHLLQYDELRTRFQLLESSSRQLEEIPLSSIVGTVGRYTDFTRQLLPLNESDRNRWARVRQGVANMQGLPPIEVYQVGDAYFILDGHHRASVARELGASHIEAYVRKVQTPIPLTPEDSIEDVILKAERADFLSTTHFQEILPEEDVQVSFPGSYAKLSEQISVHRYFMGIDQRRDIPYEEAVSHWYHDVYLPVIDDIRRFDLLHDFRDRTEADMFLWVVEYRKDLQERLGLKVDTTSAASDLLNRFSPNIYRIIRRIVDRTIDAILPDELGLSPPPGIWQEQREKNIRSQNLFKTILVAVPGDKSGWKALDFGLLIAQKEGAFVGGLHAITKSSGNDECDSIKAEFSRRCAASKVESEITFERGKPGRLLYERSYWADLLILRKRYTPPLLSVNRLDPGFRNLIQKRKTPILAVPPGYSGDISRILLAYGGGRNADEALFVAAYLARKWQTELFVVVVAQKGLDANKELNRAKEYLIEHGVLSAHFDILTGPPAQAILLQGEQFSCDLILTGGYESGYFRDRVFSSTIDRILLMARCPVLICH